MVSNKVVYLLDSSRAQNENRVSDQKVKYGRGGPWAGICDLLDHLQALLK